MQNVEVYEVGKEQLWDWCSWSRRGLDCGGYGASMVCHAESLRKGGYVVVELSACFVHVAKPVVHCWCSSLRGARAVAENFADYDKRHFGETFGLYAHPYVTEYEIWHIVDDSELEYCTCAMCGKVVPVDKAYLDMITDYVDTVCYECGGVEDLEMLRDAGELGYNWGAVRTTPYGTRTGKLMFDGCETRRAAERCLSHRGYVRADGDVWVTEQVKEMGQIPILVQLYAKVVRLGD